MADGKRAAAAAAAAGEDEVPVRLRRSEAVLRGRSSRFVAVLDRLTDSFNVSAILRTCESLGVQHVWVVRDHDKGAGKNAQFGKSVHKSASTWLTIRHFNSPEECLEAVREEGLQVWATDLSPAAVRLDAEHCPPESLARRTAIVIGRENAGVCKVFLDAADRRVYLPMFGFTESFNVSVATALVLQRLFDLAPGARGDMPDEERAALREKWAVRLGRKSEKTMAQFRRILDSGREIEPVEELRVPPEQKVTMVPRRVRREQGFERKRKKEQEDREAKQARMAARAAAEEQAAAAEKESK